jgi:ADP-ribose pyrophosphatase
MDKKGVSVRLSEKTVFVSENKRYVVNEVVDRVNGKKITKLFKKSKGGSITIIPVLNSDTILLVRQYRPAIRGRHSDGWVYELPGGKIEGNEETVSAACRELEEETGYRAGEIVPLYDRFLAPWYSDGVDKVCVARRLVKTRTKRDKDEVMSVIPIKVSKVIEMLKKGRLKDMSTREGMLYWLSFVNKK